MTKRMRLSVSNRQKQGSTGTLLVHADLQLKCLLLHVNRCVEPELSHCWGWGIGWRCALCCMYAQWCIELETTYRGLSGWGVKRKEGKQNRYGRRSRKSKMLKVREEQKMWKQWLQFVFSDHMNHLELGITFPALNLKHLCLCKVSFMGQFHNFYKDSVICISHLHYISYLHTNPT